jgi:hypothetical protein
LGKDWGEKFRTLAAMCAVGGVAVTIFLWAFNLLPFARASDVALLSDRVSLIENGFKGMSLDQKQSLELQLMQQIDAIDVRLASLPVGGEYSEQRARRVELNQRLTNVRTAITALRGNQ